MKRDGGHVGHVPGLFEKKKDLFRQSKETLYEIIGIGIYDLIVGMT